jgi:DNA-binding GntR family transcriptional regulator
MRRLKREPAENMATAGLRNAILSGSLPPGTRLRQEEMASRLGVSRMPVRKALSVLERQGLVRSTRGGARLWHRSNRRPSGICTRSGFWWNATSPPRSPRAHRSICPGCANSSAQGATPHRGDLSGLIDLDLRFNMRLYEAVGNLVLVSVMRGQWAHIRRVMALTLTFEGYRERIWDEHEAILDAIGAQNPDRAGAVAASHITAATELVSRVSRGAPMLPSARCRTRPG